MGALRPHTLAASSRIGRRKYDAADVSAAWIGVIGVLGGVVLGAVVNIVGDRFRWQREEARLRSARVQAMEDRRRVLAVDFASMADELTSRVWSFIQYRTSSRKNWLTDPVAQAQADKIDTVVAAFDRSYNELRILGMGTEMAEAADELLSRCVDAVNAAYDDDGDWDGGEVAEANGDFLAASHTELGLARRRPVARPSPSAGPRLVRQTRPRRRIP
jgi:hypothetical protein